MSLVMSIAEYLPGIKRPSGDLSFRDKLQWTGIILLLYFVMSEIFIFGASSQQVAQFQQLQTILGSSIGTLITLGIGPIVSASIILQLLVGADILPWNTSTSEGRAKFQSTQKLLAYLFAIFEAFAFVGMGAISPTGGASFSNMFFWLVVFQVALGGALIILMDEVISKWGFGSGVSLFILAGVSKTIVIQLLSPFTTGGVLWFSPTASSPPSGVLFQLYQVLTGTMQVSSAYISIFGLLATITVFLVAVYAQAMRVEIPLTFGNVRGFGQKWPLKFIYTNVIPVIFVGAIVSNFQLVGSLLANRVGNLSISLPGLGEFFLIHSSYTGQQTPLANTALFYFTAPTNFLSQILSSIQVGALQVSGAEFLQVFIYTAFYVVGSAIFSIFWMQTSGQDPNSVAKQISNIGMKIPGHRKDTRVIEKILKRYIPALAVLGGAFVGLLAAVANWTNAYGSGTGILLAVMIAFQLYEELAKKHLEDMHPAFKKFMSGGLG